MAFHAPIAFAPLLLLAAGCAGRPALHTAPKDPIDSALSASLRVVVVAPPHAATGLGAEGSLRTALFADPRQWPSGTPAFRTRTPFVDGRGEATFEQLPAGAYAIVAFLDLDGDGELDRGAFGVPSEPIAYGNDAKPRFGPPSFDACVVEVGGAAREVTLTLVVE